MGLLYVAPWDEEMVRAMYPSWFRVLAEEMELHKMSRSGSNCGKKPAVAGFLLKLLTPIREAMLSGTLYVQRQ